MSDRWTDTLSDYLDDDMSAAEARELEAHMESCEECRATLAGLRMVKERARTLVDPPAPDDLWAGIASQIGTAGSTSHAKRARVIELPSRMHAWATPWAIAAGLALMLTGAGAMWVVQRAHLGRDPVATRTSEPSIGAQYASFDAERVEGEIAQLQGALERGRHKLDPQTVRVLETNLTIIRQATDDARKALAADPANRDLQNYFAGTVERKLQLVKRAATMAGV